MSTISGSLIFDLDRSGTLTSGDSGIGNISIVLQNTITGARVTCTTNSIGAFEFINVPNGNYRLVEAYGEPAGINYPADFSLASIGPAPVAKDPLITNVIAPPVGATNLDSTTSNTIFLTVLNNNFIGQNFFDGPIKYTPINNLLDSCATVQNINLITAADNGTFGVEPAGAPPNSGPITAPYPTVTQGFTYSPPSVATIDGYYTVVNILVPFPFYSWWRLTDKSTGEETGRFMAINGDFPGIAFFQETVSVAQNKKYLFTTWVANLANNTSLTPPKLGVEILDQSGGILYNEDLQNAIPANSTVPEWKQIGTIFDSGNNNQVTVKFLSNGALSNNGNDYAIDEIKLQPITVPTFTPVKSVDKVYANVSDIVTYTVTLTNGCASPLTSVFFQDILNPGLQFVAGSVTGGTNPSTDNPNIGFLVLDIPGNSTATVTFKAKVTSIPASNPILNTATMDYKYTPVQGGIPNDFKESSNTVPVTIKNANLDIVKSVDKTSAIVGDIILYTLNVTNTGNVPASSVVITDILPSGTSYVGGSIISNKPITGDPTIGITVTSPIAPSDNVIISFQAKINTLPNPNPIVNTAKADFKFLVDPNGVLVNGSNTSNSVRTDVGTETLSKSVDKSNATVGDILTYTVKVTNPGVAPVYNTVFNDPLPIGVTYAGGLTVSSTYTGTDPMSGITLIVTNPGKTITISWKVQVVNYIPTPNPIVNVGTIRLSSGTEFKTNQATTQINEAELEIIKSVNKNEAAVGDILTYTLNVTNIGNVNASSIVITDAIPPGTIYVPGSTVANVIFTGDLTTTINLILPLAPGNTVVIGYKVKIDTLPVPNPILNTAKANYTYKVEPNGQVIDRSNTSNTVDTAVGDVIAIKSVDKSYADLGDVVVYTVTLQNPGIVAVNNVIFQDLLPNGMIYANSLVVSVPYTGVDPMSGLVISSVAAGASVTISWKVIVMYNRIPSPNPIVNVGVITTPGGKITPTNQVTTKVNHADLIKRDNFIKSVDKENAQPGDMLTYTITVTNRGNVAANNVIITDPIPAGTTYVLGSIVVSEAFTGSPLTSINLTAPIGAGVTVTITFKVKVDNVVPSTNPIPNQAGIKYDYKTNPANPDEVKVTGVSNTVNTNISIAKLEIKKNVNKCISYMGDTINYNISIKNTGNVPANDVVIEDEIPHGTNYVVGSLTVNVPYTGDISTRINLTNSINPGQVISISFLIKVMAIPNPNPIKNIAKSTYKYTVDPQNPDGIDGVSESNIATTKVFKYNFSKEITDLINSIALEEAALASIVDSEGKKIQAMVAMNSITTEELLCLNKNVEEMINSITILELILKQKMDVVDCQINCN
ncbi:MAG: hypothetical protein RR620_13590 [Clostridium sp.]